MSYYAKNVYTATAGQTDFTAPTYRVTSEIKVYKNGVLTTAWTWFSSSVVRLNAGASEGDILVIERQTERATRLVEFQKGPIYTDDLNTANVQNIQNIQEMWDKIADAIIINYEGLYDFAGRRATNAADPINATDLITKGYLDSTYNEDLNDAVEAAMDEADAAADSAFAALASQNAALGYANAAAQSATDADASADLAQDWANEDEDVVVNGGQYSARHYSYKAQEWAEKVVAATEEITVVNAPSATFTTSISLAGPGLAVFINGVAQPPSAWTINSTYSITFDEELPVGTHIYLVSIDSTAIPTGFGRLAVAAEWTKQQNFDAAALTSSGNAVAWNLDNAQAAKLTMTENTTVSAPTNMKDGAFYSLIVTQDSSTAFTLAWNAVFSFGGAGTPAVISANKKAIFTFYCDGSTLYGMESWRSA